jgi:hypothetical protein
MPAARGDPVQITIDEQFQQDSRIIPRPTGSRRRMTMEPEGGQIEFIDEENYNAKEVVFDDTVLQALGKSVV